MDWNMVHKICGNPYNKLSYKDLKVMAALWYIHNHSDKNALFLSIYLRLLIPSPTPWLEHIKTIIWQLLSILGPGS
jgi:hypothetical protein